MLSLNYLYYFISIIYFIVKYKEYMDLKISPSKCSYATKTQNIRIKQTKSLDYDVEECIFDPVNLSPPQNSFLNKLMLRIKNYDSFTNLCNLDTK
jgi:hypothetical protein